jgi:hypothetical protein
MISSAEVVRRIIAAQAPVLFPDTYSLLDLMRDPTRESFYSEQVEAARRLLIRAEARPRTIWLAIGSQVLAERRDHQLNVRQAEATIRRLEECVHRVQRTMTAHGLKTTEIEPTLVASNFPETASGMVDQYFSAGLHVQHPRGIERKAYVRIAANKASSKKRTTGERLHCHRKLPAYCQTAS